MFKRDAASKKPSGGRPTPRRLFSVDSLKSTKPSTEYDASSIISKDEHHARSASTTLLRIPEKSDSDDPFADGWSERWTEKEHVESPDQQPEIIGPPRSGKRHGSKPSSLNFSVETKSDLEAPSTAGDPIPPPSPSKRRWDTIRTHVTRSSGAPSFEHVKSPSISSPSTPPPSRPQTPSKQHRFAQKKIFRNVVEQAREVAVDETRRLAEEIRKACWTVRFGEVPSRQKIEREATQGTLGSSLHLPFMSSTTSLPIAASASQSTVQVPQKYGQLRRPPSIQSLAAGSDAPSVIHITRALTSTSSMSRPPFLPYEYQVLSALLVPFLGPHRDQNIPLEQEMAVETFEYITRTWKAPSSEAELERCMWCCKAASVASQSRMRILGALSSVLFSREKPFEVQTPPILQTLLGAMFSLLLHLSTSPDSQPQAESLRAYIGAIRSGQCGTLAQKSVEKEYGARFSSDDSDSRLLSLMITESLVGFVETANMDWRRWAIHNLFEEYWPLPERSGTMTPLLECVQYRTLKIFLGCASSLLLSSSSESKTFTTDSTVVIQLLRSRVLPEMEAMKDEPANELRASVVRLVAELFRNHDSPERDYLSMSFLRWYQDGGPWATSIDTALRDMIADAEWPTILRLLPVIVEELPENLQLRLTSFVLPLLNDRLMAAPPEIPCPLLSGLLALVSRLNPKTFFKPLFTCAASAKDLTIANQLCILNILAKYIPDFWIRDAEMLSVALMSEPVINKSGAQGGSKPRLGQLVLLVELVEYLRAVRQAKDLTMTTNAAKFVSALETRLGVLLLAKEERMSIPVSQRALFCALFKEIRLLTRSLKPAPWLPLVISWASDELSSSFDHEQDECMTTIDKLRALYAQAQEGLRGSNKRTTIAFVPIVDAQHKAGHAVQIEFNDKIKWLMSLQECPNSTILEFLVCVSGLLGPPDYAKLSPVIWHRNLDGISPKVIAPACFLAMQCAEKSSKEFEKLLYDDLSSPDAEIRRRAIARVAVITSWRFQLLSQDVILDRSYRRPFKLARPPILFVPTDIGTSTFVLEEDPNEFKDSNGHVIPLELRRRLSEIGWAQEDRYVDPKTEWIKTPMSLLPSLNLDLLASTSDDSIHAPESPNPSPAPSPEATPTKSSSHEAALLRRDSSTSGRSHGAKRRPVFVSTLVSCLPHLVSMVKDDDFNVSNAALNLVNDLMRDDPTLLSRAIFHDLSGDTTSMISAITTLRLLLHIRHLLPPGMAFHVLNHLAGFLKTSGRQPNSNPLQCYAYTIPVIDKLISQVSKVSVREIRRAKIDMFLMPSGSLWFPPSAPSGPMFPRGPISTNPFEELPSSLVWITLVRTSQNMLFIKLLKLNPQDIRAIRKNISRLVLPSLDNNEPTPLSLADFIPRRKTIAEVVRTTLDDTLTALSLTLARSHLLLVSKIFQSVSRHLSDREELQILLDGVNQILLVHGDDIGIVGHAMLVYMVASTRFRRLFISGGGYTLFMPVLVKTYAEAESHTGIKSAIEYAINRFYALHQESFIFQSFDVIAKLMALPEIDSRWLANNIFALFASLKHGIPPSSSDVAGIHDLNKVQEQEALILTVAEQVPQTFLNTLRKNSQDKKQLTMEVPDEYEGKRLRIDDLVRLFLTVIAHNPAVARAERFLRFLVALAPELYNASSSTRTVLREGIDALGGILLMKASGKSKAPDGPSTQIRPPDDFNVEAFVDDASTNAPGLGSTSSTNASSDSLAMRLDYLSLATAFTKAGGQLGVGASHRIMEIVKVVLKDPRLSIDRISKFLAEYSRAVLVRDPPPSIKEVELFLTDLAPIVAAYSTSVKFGAVYDVLAELSKNTVFSTEIVFTQLIVTQFCSTGLDACELAASEDLLFSLALRTSLIPLMCHAVSFVGCDVIAEVEKRKPTYDLLSGVVLPFALTLKTKTEIARQSPRIGSSWLQDVHARAWVRLLYYTLSACQRKGFQRNHSRTHSNGTERDSRKSQDGRSSQTTSFQPVMTLAMALQLLKVIITRAEDDISAALPGVWAQIGATLRSLLADGDAAFALNLRDRSEPPSPLHSPRADTFAHADSDFLLPSSISVRSTKRFSRPRVIDYLTWSLVQWLCLRRSPLVIQMRSFVQEKLAILNQQLLLQNGLSVQSTSRARSRPVSIFAKPRRSMLGNDFPSAASTPRNSFLNTSTSLPTFDDDGLQSSTPRKLDINTRLAGYARQASPSSPTYRAARDSGPRIIHLGPISAPSRSSSPSGESSSMLHAQDTRDALAAAKEMTVNSYTLVQATYRKIRLAQTLAGYSNLLPFGGDEEDEEEAVRTWSQREALEMVTQETRELMEEFREPGWTTVGEGTGFFVDVEEPSSPGITLS